MCIAKTLAYANQIPLKAISSLNAYATADASVVLLDAKAQRCYLGVYQQHKPLIQECVVSIEKAKELLQPYLNFEYILDAHLMGKLENKPHHIIQQMIDLAKDTPYVKDVHSLTPLYLKDE